MVSAGTDAALAAFQQDLSWQTEAACKGNRTICWAPIEHAAKHASLNARSSASLANVAAAKKVCERCPVLNFCLAYALEADDRDTICGGMTAIERRFFVKSYSKNRLHDLIIELRSV